MRKTLVFLLFFLSLCHTFSKPIKPNSSGLPLPRFASLKSDKARLRTGPGKHYNVVVVYRLRNMPLKIVAEFGQWRKVTDFEKTTGWIHKSLLSGNKTVLTLKNHYLRQKPSIKSSIIANIHKLNPLFIKKREKGWLQVSMMYKKQILKGWISEKDLFGLKKNSTH